MKKDSGHLAGKLMKSRIQKEPHLKSAICSPSMSSSCLEQCLAQRWMNAKWCLRASVLHATHLGAYMLYGGEGLGFAFFLSFQSAEQGRWDPGPWGGGAREYRPRRKKGICGQLGEPFHRRQVCTTTQMRHKEAQPQIKASLL